MNKEEILYCPKCKGLLGKYNGIPVYGCVDCHSLFTIEFTKVEPYNGETVKISAIGEEDE